jgi:hypothetical protein
MAAIGTPVDRPVPLAPPQPAPPSVLSGPRQDPLPVAAILARLLERAA